MNASTCVACDNPGSYFPGYRYRICQGCYDAAYLNWYLRVTNV